MKSRRFKNRFLQHQVNWMFSIILILLLISINSQKSIAQQKFEELPVVQPRDLVLTDITNEPDDQQSLVRFLVYANEFDIEGLIATTSTHMHDEVRPDVIKKLVTAYGEVRSNLLKHADGYPAEQFLLKRTKAHLPVF